MLIARYVLSKAWASLDMRWISEGLLRHLVTIRDICIFFCALLRAEAYSAASCRTDYFGGVKQVFVCLKVTLSVCLSLVERRTGCLVAVVKWNMYFLKSVVFMFVRVWWIRIWKFLAEMDDTEATCKVSASYYISFDTYF